jgi:hypothetical protein
MPPYQGVFEKMNFPKYSFKEYPKRVVGPGGKRVTVHSQKEEVQLEMSKPAEETVANPLAEENAKLVAELAALRAQMEKEGAEKLSAKEKAKAEAVKKAEDEEKARAEKVKKEEEEAEAEKVKATLAAQKPKSLAETLSKKD